MQMITPNRPILLAVGIVASSLVMCEDVIPATGASAMSLGTLHLRAFQSVSVQAEPQYVHVDSIGDLDVMYPANLDTPKFPKDPGPLVSLHIARRTRTAPSPKVSIRTRPSGDLEYEYVVENGSEASQAIDHWILILPASEFIGERGEPDMWKHIAQLIHSPSEPGVPYYLNPPGYFADWFTPADSEGIGPGVIAPGAHAVFTIAARSRPGFLRSFFGSGFFEDHTSNMPGSVAAEMNPFRTIEGRMQSRVILGPAFAPNVRRDAMAAGLRASVASLISTKQLAADSPFVLEAIQLLDRAGRTPNAASAEVRFQNEPTGELERELRLAIDVDLGSGP
jgi:hypothetical protein